MTTAADRLDSSKDFTTQIGQGLEFLGDTIKTPYYRGTEWFVSDARVTGVVKKSFAFLFGAATSLLSIPFYVLGGLVEATGGLITQKPFHHIRGDASESWNERKFSIFDLNVCMYWGGLPIPFGGVDPARLRLPQLAKLIQEKDADIVALQELSFGEGRKLASLLKDKYAHFYTNIGGLQAKTTFYSAGTELFFASKAPIVSEPKYIPYPNPHGEKLGFFCIETPTCWFLTAHFPDGKKEMWATRRELLDLVHSTAVRLKKETGKSYCFTGDLNIRSDEYTYAGIGDKFFDPGTKKYPNFSEETSTCTNVLSALRTGKEAPKDDPFETDDYVLFDKGFEERYNVEITLGKETYDLAHPEEAISDHRYYHATITAKEGVELVTAPEPAISAPRPNTSRHRFAEALLWLGSRLEALSDYSDIQLSRNQLTPIRPNEFGNYDNPFLERIRRTFNEVLYGTIFYPIAAGLKRLGGALQSTALNMTNLPYAYVKGDAHEEWGLEDYKIYSRNACMFNGGRPMHWGGMMPAEYRKDYADHIRELGVKVYVGQEITYTAGLELAKQLKKDFAHFYIDFGPIPGKYSSCLFIASKLPFISQPRFYSFPVGGKQHSDMNRGVACLETEGSWILTFHMEHTWAAATIDSKGIRKAQLEYIADVVIPELKKISNKPCILAGDSNIQRKGEAGDEYESSGFETHFYNPVKVTELTPKTATCSNVFTDTMQGKKKTSESLEIDDHVGVDIASASQVRLGVSFVPDVLDDTVSPWPNDLTKPYPLSDHKGALISVQPVI